MDTTLNYGATLLQGRLPTTTMENGKIETAELRNRWTDWYYFKERIHAKTNKAYIMLGLIIGLPLPYPGNLLHGYPIG